MDIYLAQNALSLISLFTMALQDLKYKKISCFVLYVYLFTGAINACFTRYPVNIVISAMPGIVLLILGLVTNEKIGYGMDSRRILSWMELQSLNRPPMDRVDSIQFWIEWSERTSSLMMW